MGKPVHIDPRWAIDSLYRIRLAASDGYRDAPDRESRSAFNKMYQIATYQLDRLQPGALSVFKAKLEP